jgi:ABC-2 type transport system permease protein
MQGVIEEKETRVIEILVASLRPSQLLIGKILAYGTLGLLQFVVWLGGMLFVLSQADFFSSIAILGQFSLPPATVPLMLVYFVLAYLFFASAYGILGALSTSMREGPQFAVIFTLPAVAPLWFTSLFIATPDAPLVVGLSLFPLTAPLGMLQRVLVSDVPAWQIALSLVLLALTIVGVMWLAGRVFRVQTLLAGQLPKLRDLPRLVRG